MKLYWLPDHWCISRWWCHDHLVFGVHQDGDYVDTSTLAGYCIGDAGKSTFYVYTSVHSCLNIPKSKPTSVELNFLISLNRNRYDEIDSFDHASMDQNTVGQIGWMCYTVFASIPFDDRFEVGNASQGFQGCI